MTEGPACAGPRAHDVLFEDVASRPRVDSPARPRSPRPRLLLRALPRTAHRRIGPRSCSAATRGHWVLVPRRGDPERSEETVPFISSYCGWRQPNWLGRFDRRGGTHSPPFHPGRPRSVRMVAASVRRPGSPSGVFGHRGAPRPGYRVARDRVAGAGAVRGARGGLTATARRRSRFALGGSHDAELFNKTPNVEVAYVCDVDVDRREEAAKNLRSPSIGRSTTCGGFSTRNRSMRYWWRRPTIGTPRPRSWPATPASTCTSRSRSRTIFARAG